MSLISRRSADRSALFVDYGQPALKSERDAARYIADYYQTNLVEAHVRLPPPGAAFEVPGRNALLVSLAVVLGGGQPGSIAIGIHGGTPYPDCTGDFVRATQRQIDSQFAGNVVLLAPFVGWSKSEVYELALSEGVPVQSTYSCESAPTPCGACPSCLDRGTLDRGT